MDYKRDNELIVDRDYKRPRRRFGWLPLLLLIPLLLVIGVLAPRVLKNQNNGSKTNTLSRQSYVSPIPTDSAKTSVAPTADDPTIESGAKSATARNASEAQDRSAYPQQGIGGSGDDTSPSVSSSTVVSPSPISSTRPQSGIGGSGIVPSGVPSTGRGGE
jgi:hypothetical protein